MRATRLNDAKISPFQAGQFVEFLSNVVPSMHAEKIYDGSFLGLRPYIAWHIRQNDFQENKWYPSGAVHRSEYLLDPANPFNGNVSQRITATGEPPCVLGISQDGIFVEKGKKYIVSVFLRQQELATPVTARISQAGRTLASCQFEQIGSDWTKFQASVEASETSTNATLTFEFRGPATLWIDKVSLMPAQTVAGWRPDVVDAVRAMRPGIIRFGGTAVREYYEWEQGIGELDRRIPFAELATGGLQPNNAGLDELISLFLAVGAEPLICVRFTGKTPADAATQVEYCNGAIDNTIRKTTRRQWPSGTVRREILAGRQRGIRERI